MYHVYARGNDKQTIFPAEDDCLMFLSMLRNIKREHAFRLYAYALMSNHFHLALEVAQSPVSLIMQRLLRMFSGRFNEKYGRIGHVFQGRFGSKDCTRDSYLLELVRYIHLNPVRAGLVSDPADWRWSGHADYCAPRPDGLVDTETILGMLAPEQRAARQEYQRLVLAGLGLGHEAKFYTAPEETASTPSLPQHRPMRSPQVMVSVDLESLGREIAVQTKVGLSDIRSRRATRMVSAARHRFIQSATEAGFSAAAIAGFLGCTVSLVSKVRYDSRNR